MVKKIKTDSLGQVQKGCKRHKHPSCFRHRSSKVGILQLIGDGEQKVNVIDMFHV